jgi:hypothetical protein
MSYIDALAWLILLMLLFAVAYFIVYGILRIGDEDMTPRPAFPPVDYSKPIHIPDEWVTWPGKDRGEPKPPIIWANDEGRVNAPPHDGATKG